LKLIPECTDVIILAAQEGVPVNIISMAMVGATSPVTLAGTLVTHNAEVLSAIILSQLTKKGAPCIYASSTTLMDMRLCRDWLLCTDDGGLLFHGDESPGGLPHHVRRLYLPDARCRI